MTTTDYLYQHCASRRLLCTEVKLLFRTFRVERQFSGGWVNLPGIKLLFPSASKIPPWFFPRNEKTAVLMHAPSTAQVLYSVNQQPSCKGKIVSYWKKLPRIGLVQPRKHLTTTHTTNLFLNEKTFFYGIVNDTGAACLHINFSNKGVPCNQRKREREKQIKKKRKVNHKQCGSPEKTLQEEKKGKDKSIGRIPHFLIIQ